MSKSKKNSFSLNPPTGTWVHFLSLLHELENICLWQEEQCWSGLVFLASCSHWYCAVVFNSAVFFCFPPHNDVIFIMLFIFFLNKSSVKKKRHLQDLILRVLEHMGERLYVPSTVMIFHGVEKQQMYLLQAVLQPFLPLPPPDGGKRGLQFYFMQFKCHLSPYIQYSCLGDQSLETEETLVSTLFPYLWP